MPLKLTNDRIEIEIDLPSENYQRSRFDWTGKITSLHFKGKSLTGAEYANPAAHPFCGQGLYNEFGIDTALGFEEVAMGEWFHKIGVGLLKKDTEKYLFHHVYEIQPAHFEVFPVLDSVKITCESPFHNGYAYFLEKEIRLFENQLEVTYRLENRGLKPIVTNEYNHNFLAIGAQEVGEAYLLSFPFQLTPALLGEAVNPGDCVQIGDKRIQFSQKPQDPFFFSNLSASKKVEAKWTLTHRKSGLGISESCNFETAAVNLWGWGHVISPELFIEIDVKASQTKIWKRVYEVSELG